MLIYSFYVLVIYTSIFFKPSSIGLLKTKNKSNCYEKYKLKVILFFCCENDIFS